MQNILNYNPQMEYRRFGKTNEKVSVITLGGMRYKHGWDDPREVIPSETLDQAISTVDKSLKMGVNHIETAYGYKKSEHIYGKVLNEILNVPRENYYLMTKGDPATAADVEDLIKRQQDALQTDYFDFYAWHGINNQERFDMALGKGKAVEGLLKMKEKGVIKHLGFSTHAPLEIIIKAIETDYFDFVNLHYYYFFQRNMAAIQLAETKDMGVFIISPNDKGGQLFKAPEKVKQLTAPLTPIQWNARFCLSNPAIHTLTFGMTADNYIDEVPGIMPASVPLSADDTNILHQMDAQKLSDPYAFYEGYDLQHDASNINIPEVLRFRMLWKCYDMNEFGTYRYNMFKEEDAWFQGKFATPENVADVDTSKLSHSIPVKELLVETHEALVKKKEPIVGAKLKLVNG